MLQNSRDEWVSSVNKGCTGHLCVCGLGLIYEHQNESILAEWAFQEARKALMEQQTQMEEEVKQESDNKEDKVSPKGKTELGEMGRGYLLLPESRYLTWVSLHFSTPGARMQTTKHRASQFC